MRRELRIILGVLVPLAAGPARADDAPGLRPTAYTPLPVGAIRPSGWLATQLKLQADGLTGRLAEFWPDIRDSAWIGGKAEGWERVPYWLDGAVPLAVLTDDPKLMATVKRYIDRILADQNADGWLGPVGDSQKHKPYDVWPLFPLFKALVQYQEATGDPRIVPALMKCARKIDEVITKEPLYSWAEVRAADLALPLYWLYDRTQEAWLLDLARKVFAQSHDWAKQYGPEDRVNPRYLKRVTEGADLTTHGVNHGMAIKYGGVRSRLKGEEAYRDAPARMLAILDRYHGQANGLFSCDEHLAGRMPSQGSELCTVVEAMYALEELVSITGDVALADRLELLAFNALPATISADWTAHQYDQQVNQVVCKVSPEHVYATNGPDSNLFGLEPNFGCCTANMHQGWPKYASRLWMTDLDGDLVGMSFAPCVVRTKVRGVPVTVEVKTQYPFRETVEIAITADGAIALPKVSLFVPTWAEGASFSRSDRPSLKPFELAPGKVNAVADVSLKPGQATTLTLTLPMKPALREGENRAVSLRRGPLVYALRLPAEKKVIRDREGLPFDDYELHPKGDWNLALQLDRHDPGRSVFFREGDLGANPFADDAFPMTALVQGRAVPGWGIEKNAAAPPPESPVTTDAPVVRSLQLVPYGAARLRVAEFPTLPPAGRRR
jgi:hypothetical protein